MADAARDFSLLAALAAKMRFGEAFADGGIGTAKGAEEDDEPINRVTDWSATSIVITKTRSANTCENSMLDTSFAL